MLRQVTRHRILTELTPGRAFLLGAVVWTLAHLMVYLPQGWPFPVRGEWDVLLPAAVFADGEIPRRWLAGLASHEGALVPMSLLAAGPLALGLDPTLVARLLALGFGALTAGSLATLAWHAAPPAEGPSEGRGFAACTAALWVALTLPAWHSEVLRLDGSTPEATALMLAGLAALAGTPGKSRTLGAGVLLAVATLLSPVTAPGIAVGVVMTGGRRGALLLLGTVPVYAASMALGGGLGSSTDWVSLAGSAPAGTRAHDLVLLLPRALHAATAGLAPATLGSRLLGACTIFSVFGAATLLRRPRPAWTLGAAALGFLVLTLWTPSQYRGFPPAYRYWQPALLLCSAGLGAALAWAPRRWWGLALVPVVVFVLGPGRRSLPPITTQTESLFAAGVHKMGPDPSSDHALLRELAPHAPADGGEGLLLGYGLLIGQKASERGLEAPFVTESWDALLQSLPQHHAQAVSFGVGYGLTAPCDPTAEQLAQIAQRPEREWVAFGIARAQAARDGAARDPGDSSEVRPPDGSDRWDSALMDELSDLQPPAADCPAETQPRP